METKSAALQQIKMAWLAAKEAGDTQAQIRLLRDHPEYEAALIDFIAAYTATNTPPGQVESNEEVLSPMTQRALQTALARVFPAPVAVANVSELRKLRGFDKSGVATALRLSVSVWQKFENGSIQLASLSERQLDRLAQFFQVSVEQFSTLLGSSQPTVTPTMYRRTSQAARKSKSGSKAMRQETFADAIAHSDMSKEDRKFWLNEETTL